MILDGWGMKQGGDNDALSLAQLPNFDHLWNTYPHTQLDASGMDVGLPEGQMGNSEVGHMNIGAGRVVYQDYTRINMAVDDGSFFKNPAFLKKIVKDLSRIRKETKRRPARPPLLLFFLNINNTWFSIIRS